MRIYILKLDNKPLYFISHISHITKLQLLVNKYCPDNIVKHSTYDIPNHYKEHPHNLTVKLGEDATFWDYFKSIFGKYKYNKKEYWYEFDTNILGHVIKYLSDISNLKKTNKLKIDKQIFHCEKCKKELSSKIYLEKHLLICEGLTCKKCNVYFSNKTNYINHYKNCGIFECQNCKKKLKSKFKYNKHIQNCKIDLK